VVIACEAPAPAPRTDLAGARIQAPGDPAIYLIDDDGTRRHIPDVPTYDNLFRDFSGIQSIDVSTIPSHSKRVREVLTH
jgi:hypothetical protein